MHDLMDTAPCGFVAFADDGTIREINQTLTDMLGYKRLELLGWHVEKILPPGGRIFYHTYLFPMLKVQATVEEVYLALRTRDARDIPVLLNGSRRERDGQFISDCVCLRMIRRHAYEDQLLEARRLAEESNAARARFLSMMSHDLRAPLTTISGNAQLLANQVDGPLNPDQLESVEAIRLASRTQLAMVTDILEFARLDSGRVQVQPRPVSASEVVSRAAAIVRLQADEAGLSMTSVACDDSVMILADPDRLQQILLNLLVNAIKFTPAGGEIAIICASQGDRARIQVRDSGVGIAADQLPRIFAPFVQLESSPPRPTGTSRGVGLGLAISRDLARMMGGDVTAESTLGVGSVFTIDLPAVMVSGLEKQLFFQE